MVGIVSSFCACATFLFALPRDFAALPLRFTSAACECSRSFCNIIRIFIAHRYPGGKNVIIYFAGCCYSLVICFKTERKRVIKFSPPTTQRLRLPANVGKKKKEFHWPNQVQPRKNCCFCCSVVCESRVQSSGAQEIRSSSEREAAREPLEKEI